MTSQTGPGEPGDFIAQMQQIVDQAARAEAELGAMPIEGTAAGGLVRVRVSGEQSFEAVTIDPSVVDPTDVTMLEDLLLAALRDATVKLQEARRGVLGGLVRDALGGDPFGMLASLVQPDEYEDEDEGLEPDEELGDVPGPGDEGDGDRGARAPGEPGDAPEGSARRDPDPGSRT